MNLRESVPSGKIRNRCVDLAGRTCFDGRMEKKSENVWLSLAANIAIPALILSKGAEWLPQFSPALRLIIALAFPCVYFFYDYVRRREANWISVLGFAGTLLTGGIGLMQLSPFWVAVKEAAIPALIAVVLTLSRKMGDKILFSEKIFNIDAIHAACAARGTLGELKKTLKRASWLLVASFVFSAVLNFLLARWIVVTEPAENLDAFNAELGKMLSLSWPVIVLPCMVFMFAALYVLLNGLKKTTGLPFEKLLKEHN